MRFLKALTETPGVSGREERVRELIRGEAGDLFDEVREDAMGNLIMFARPRRKPPKGVRPRKIMISCHLDEIGFYVKFVDDKGYLRLQNVGGFDTRNLFARRVLVQGKEDLVGLLCAVGKPIHISTPEERKKIPEVEDFYVDLFLPEAVVKKSVRIGDPVTLVQETIEIGQVVTGKALDNRMASWVGLNAIRKARARCPHEIYYVGTAQEEVGCRGAGVAAYEINPDDGIAIDGTLACDTPGVGKDLAVSELGKGCALKVLDGASISTRSLLDEFIALAEARKIPHQMEVLPRGGTDAATIQRSGPARRVFTLSVPMRYVHTITEAVHRKDLEAAVELLAAWLGQ